MLAWRRPNQLARGKVLLFLTAQGETSILHPWRGHKQIKPDATTRRIVCLQKADGFHTYRYIDSPSMTGVMGHDMRCLSAAESLFCLESIIIPRRIFEVSPFRKVIALKPNRVHGGRY